jgi:ABC-type multidrug transport system fused ATPase/permease subunit
MKSSPYKVPERKTDAELLIEASVPPESMEHLPDSPFWKTLWKFARPCRGALLVAAICAMVVGAIIPMQMQYTVKRVVDAALESYDLYKADEPIGLLDALQPSLFFVVFFLFLSALRIVIWIVGYRRMLASIEWILCRLRGLFFRHVQRMCFRFHDQISSGELFNYIMGSPMAAIKQFLQQFCMMVPYQIVGWFVSVGLLAAFNWKMMLITVASAVAAVGLNRRSRHTIRAVSDEFMKTESEASKYIADVLRGSRAIKTYAMEDNVSALFSHQITQIRDQGYNLAVRQQIEHIKPECVQYLGLGVVLFSGAYYVVRGEMTAGTFMAFILSFNMLMQPIMSLLQLNLIRANAESGLDRIMRIMQVAESTPEPVAADLQGPDGDARRTKGSGNLEAISGICFENLSFSYATHTPVLRGINCHIREGESVALVGPSGSGKSTFVSLLLRFYDPQAGRILVSGADIRSYRLRELRSQFGVVPQDPFIFQATLRDNLCVTNPDATAEQVQAAVRAACLEAFLAELPLGLDTRIGEGGSNLSGGQRQRVAIARAILANPQYFIFDEATSALDNTSERHIQQAMDALMQQHTTIVIAHRLSTIRNVNRILVFDHGQIVQDGDYATLSGKRGLFRQLLAADPPDGILGE